jgi:ribosomal protein S18 acetylase RimI-like enzyme
VAATIREATVEDARAIAEVHVEGWRWAFRGQVPDAVIDGLDVDRREQEWIVGFTDDWHDGDACFLAEDGTGRVVGFVACGPAPDAYVVPPPNAGEIYSIFLREEARGTGVGRELFARAVQSLRANGFKTGVLWVLESNDLARRFYEVAGWAWDGARAKHPSELGARPLVRYVAPLADGAI